MWIGSWTKTVRGTFCVCETSECQCSEGSADEEEEGEEEKAKRGAPKSPPPISSNDSDEFSVLPLPSNFQVLPEEWKSLAQKEEKLRVAQANEALQALRWAVAEKSRIYRINPLLASGKKGRTRGYDAIKQVEKEMRFLMKKYVIAKRSLHLLGVAAKYPQFQALTRHTWVG